MSPPKIVHAPACDRKTASASAVFVHFQRRKKFFHGSTLISHSTGHPKTGIPSADNGAKPGHGYSGVKRHSPCQRRTPSDALIAVALHPRRALFHRPNALCTLPPEILSLLRCSIHLSVILYSTIIICDFGGFVNEFFVAQNDFLPAAYFASSSLQVCRIPAPWSAT